jgi:hypothetical protein
MLSLVFMMLGEEQTEAMTMKTRPSGPRSGEWCGWRRHTTPNRNGRGTGVFASGADHCVVGNSLSPPRATLVEVLGCPVSRPLGQEMVIV